MYIGDLLGDTMHLTAAEFGAYHWIMYHQWRSGPIPERSLRAVSRLSKDEWADSEQTIKAFLSVDDNGCYFQKRTASEKEKSDKLSEVSRKNGLKGGRPKNPENPEETQQVTQKEPSRVPREEAKPNPEGTQRQTPSPSPSQSYSKAPPSEPNALALTSVEVHATVFDLPLIADKGEWGLSEKLYGELVKAYPGVSVMGELAKMRTWLLANSKNRKTPDGLPRFINNWLSKAQNNGGSTYAKPTIDASIAARQALLDRRSAGRVASDSDYSGRTIEAGTGSSGESGRSGAPNGSLFRTV